MKKTLLFLSFVSATTACGLFIGTLPTPPDSDAGPLDARAADSDMADAEASDASEDVSARDGSPADGSGVDSSDASDAVDAFDAGPLPAISAVTPNYSSAAGGWPAQISCSNCSTFTAVTTAGQAWTSTTYSSGAGCPGGTPCITGTTPPNTAGNGGTSGNATGLVTTITTPVGLASTSGHLQNEFFVPSNTPIVFTHRADVGIVLADGGLPVHLWTDVRGAAFYTWGVGPGFEPTIATNFNGTGKPYLSFAQTGNAQLMTGPDAGIQGQGLLMCVTGAASTTSSSNAASVYIGLQISGGGSIDIGGPVAGSVRFSIGDAITGLYASGSADTVPHVLCNLENGADSGIWVDTTATRGSQRNAISNSTATIGADGITGTFPFTGSLYMDFLYAGVPSTADLNTLIAIMQAISGGA